ncbi:MAG: hypothetical protein GXY34_14220 [Syntrophomonadaceae bacterium]|nr:hypothetical protein [Syntrophomonadaceae bacterium]
MNEYSIKIMEYPKIIEEIKSYALGETARERLDKLRPSSDIEVIQIWMNETSEAVAMLNANSSVPLAAMEGMEAVVIKAGKGITLTPDELTSCQNLLEAGRRIKRYMESMQYLAPTIHAYARSMYECTDLYEEIRRCIINGRVDDRASSELSRIRRRMAIVDERIKQKLNDILRSSTYSGMLQDALVSSRGGRYVVPVKRQYAKNFPGQVLDMSATGATLFIEPAAVNTLQSELDLLKMEENNEVYRILAHLSDMVNDHRQELHINIETMANYDFIFAKAKYSRNHDMQEVGLNRSRRIVINQGRHPLLGGQAVPLDFRLGEDYRALIITGPNTGGKTVTLKTVGLLTMMVQSGLHVPVGAGSEFAVFSDILADIGDGQSIEQSLSTFSSHVQNILTIVACSDPDTLAIMDELGAGTDPAEGRGFAIAVLEEVFKRGASIIATTHFGEIKEYALRTPGFENGSMAFDIETMSPCYQLRIGDWGDSNAFLIALRLGMDHHIVERAHEITYGEKKTYQYDLELVRHNIIPEAHVENHLAELRKKEDRDRRRERQAREQRYVKKDYKLGDAVYISTMQRHGIVCEEENNRGELTVLVMGKKYVVNHKRLSPYVDRKDLYPEDYDLDIVFESKENRKKRKIMGKHHVEGLTIEQHPGDEKPDKR